MSYARNPNRRLTPGAGSLKHSEIRLFPFLAFVKFNLLSVYRAKVILSRENLFFPRLFFAESLLGCFPREVENDVVPIVPFPLPLREFGIDLPDH